MTEETKRLTPSKETLNKLFAFSGNQCAHPDCTSNLFDDEYNFIGQVCHIEAAMDGGERFNKQQSNEDRRKFDNLLLLCYPHHIKTNNVSKYPVDRLREIKDAHESQYKAIDKQFVVDDQIITSVYNNLLDSIKADTANIRETTIQIKDDTSVLKQYGEDILAAIGRLSPADQSAKVKSDYNDQIDNILKFRDTNQQRVALQLFGQLKDRSWNDLSDREKYRVTANMGICHLELFENEEAAKNLIESETYQPENIRAITYAALGYVLIKDKIQAQNFIDKALKLDPENADAYSTTILLYKNESNFTELLQRIPEGVQQNTQVAFALSMAARDFENFHEAIKWANVALDNSSTNQIDLKSNLASLILESIHDAFTIASGQSNQEAITKAKYVVQLYDESWAEIKDSDLKTSRGWWLLNRGAAKRIMGDLDGCYQDVLDASNYSPTFHNLYQLVMVCVAKGYLDKAWETAEKLEKTANSEQVEDLCLLKAEIKAVNKEFPQAISIITELLSKDIDSKIDMHAQELLLKIYVNIGQLNDANNLITAMIEKYPDRITPYVFRARLKKGETDVGTPAVDDLLKAYDNISGESLSEDIRQLAMEFKNQKAYPKAIELMERITDTSVLSPISEDLLKLYYEAGETKKLLTLCNRLIDTYGPNYTLAEHQAVTYMHLNDMPNAIKSCTDYLNIYPDDQRAIVRLLLIYYKLNDWENIKKHLVKIEKLDLQLPYDVQFKVALLFFLTGEKDKCYDLAYETRKKYFDQQNAHELFVGLLMGIGSAIEHPADPNIAGVGSAVSIKTEDTLSTYVICDKQVKDFLATEISETNPIAIKVTGKKTNDIVLFDSAGEAQNYTITSILHRYNFAHIESMKLLDERFIVDKSFRKFTIGQTGNIDEDFKPLFDQLNKVVERDKYLESFMATGYATIGSLSNFKKLNPIKVWSNLLPLKSAGIKTTNGIAEFQIACSALEANLGLLFDIISLFTISQLGILDLIAGLPNDKAISQSSMNLLNELIRETEFTIDGSNSLIPFDGKFIPQSLSHDDMLGRKNMLQALHNWIVKECTVLPCNETANMLLHEKQKLDELIGESFADSLLTAKEKSYLIYSEEWNVRALGHTEYEIDGIYTFAVLAYLKSKKVIDQDRYGQLVVALMSLNYKSIPADSSVIMLAFEQFKDVKHPVFIRALTSLTSDMFTGDQTLGIVISLFYKILNSKTLEDIYKNEADITARNLITAVVNMVAQLYQPHHVIHNNLLVIADNLATTYPTGHSTIRQIVDDYFNNLDG
jgi:transcription elongation GreA/GreB family factor